MFQNQFASDFNLGASQFGAAGGFVPSPAPAAGQASQGKRNYGNNQTLRAVTVKQIAEAVSNSPDDVLRVDGEDLNNITVVGLVESVKTLESQVEFIVNDGTGRIEVKYYTDPEDDAQSKHQHSQGTYVRIHGHLRGMDNKYPLVAFSIRPVVDFNEVTYHFLSCIFQHAHFMQTANPGAAAGAGDVKPAGDGFGAGLKNSGDNPLHDAVMAVLTSAARDFSTDEVIQSLNGRYSAAQVRSAIMQVADDGKAYSTHEDRYRSCVG